MRGDGVGRIQQDAALLDAGHAERQSAVEVHAVDASGGCTARSLLSPGECGSGRSGHQSGQGRWSAGVGQAELLQRHAQNGAFGSAEGHAAAEP